MNLIWETAEAEGKYWAFSDVECPCNFRPVAMDNCPPNLRPLQQDFNIVPWVLNEYLPRLLTMQVVWEVIIGELLWKVLKTKLCINRCCKFWNGARGKNKVKELVPSYSWLMSSSLCKQRSCVIRRKFLHPNILSEFLYLTDIHGHLISPYAKWVEQWV